MSYLGADSWITRDVSRQLHRSAGSWTTWSYLWYVDSPVVLWILHLAALAIFAMLTIGIWSRVTSVLACFITLSYCHRLNGSWFGLDQVNAMLSMYLILGPCGAVYSLDRWLQRRRSKSDVQPPVCAVSTNVAIRLLQLHLCVIYLFGGISKMRGDFWWDGSAVWYAVSNLEYQSLDMTWIVRFPYLFALLTHITVFWETFYCALVWPRLTRPLVLALAVCVHGGIALFLGMITFGLAMLIVNLAFVPPNVVGAVVDRVAGVKFGAGEGGCGEQQFAGGQYAASGKGKT
jgi:hypothetical protein